jgi:hypothetical protein
MKSGKEKVVCGFNVGGGKLSATSNVLDIWIRCDPAMEFWQTDMEGVRKLLAGFNILKLKKNSIWIRISSVAEANKLLAIFMAWISTQRQ